VTLCSSDPPLPSPSNSEPSADSARVSRRRFGQRVALLAAGSLSPARIFAKPHDPHRHSESQVNDPTSQQNEEVEAKLANIVRKYGNRLSEEQRTHLRHILDYNERMLTSVRSFPLQNGDPPASILVISFESKLSSPEPHHTSPGSANTSNQREKGNR
jgi:hypothetical protein